MTEITPAKELVEKWAHASPIQHSDENWAYELYIATQAARWGADQELNACCERIYHHLDRGPEWSMDLRSTRRPKPPSLKEQALKALNQAGKGLTKSEWQQCSDIIRRALEQLDDN
jgi:hypothetical protein